MLRRRPNKKLRERLMKSERPKRKLRRLPRLRRRPKKLRRLPRPRRRLLKPRERLLKRRPRGRLLKRRPRERLLKRRPRGRLLKRRLRERLLKKRPSERLLKRRPRKRPRKLHELRLISVLLPQVMAPNITSNAWRKPVHIRLMHLTVLKDRSHGTIAPKLKKESTLGMSIVTVAVILSPREITMLLKL